MTTKVPPSDFVIDSKDHCFFCLEKIPPKLSLLNESTSNSPTLYSLQHFSRFLRLDMRKVFIEKGDIPPHLLAKVERSRLKSHLCIECASVNECFSKLCKRLEQIEMEVMLSLEQINKRLLKKEVATAELEKSTGCKEKSEQEWTAKLNILNVLRKDAIHKCSKKLKSARPKLKIQCLSESDIIQEKRNCILSSRKVPSKKDASVSSPTGDAMLEPIISPSVLKTESNESIYSDKDSDNHDFDMETGSPPPSNNRQSSPTLKRESGQFSVIIQAQPQQRKKRLNCSRISDHIERIMSPGQLSSQKSFRCKLCSKVYSDQCNTIRHIKRAHLEKPQFRCAQCSKAFYHKHTLESHMSLHSRNWSFRCQHCAKVFSRMAHLQRHLLVHSETRSYNEPSVVSGNVEVIRTTEKDDGKSQRKLRCKLCARMFSDRANIVRHIKCLHFKERKFKCSQCFKVFSSKQTLESHALREHFN